MIMDLLDSLKSLRLVRHESARQTAVASQSISKGAIIVDCASLATILLPEFKGRRCDACHVLDANLRQCSGCASYWYCSNQCQTRHWKHHRYICKLFNAYVASESYQALSAHEKMDSLLLSHTIASRGNPLFELFLTLLPGPASGSNLPLCADNTGGPDINTVYSRFGNNNFAMHSHLNTFGHGVFPLASRLFNHSCAPNAVAKYVLKKEQDMCMVVIALNDIDQGQEVCLPYFDPALTQSRHNITKYTYGFTCSCSSCTYIRDLGHIPEPPERENCRSIDNDLVSVIFPHLDLRTLSLPAAPPRPEIPASLRCIFHESYLSSLSKAFSDASHDGHYAVAKRDGIVLLTLYVLLYPPNYPQIGMHLLELAKTAWNAALVEGGSDGETEIAARFLRLSKEVLDVLGEEGDVEYGQLQEIAVLSDLLSSSG